MNVLIVESAAKAKTIKKYLGANYKVIASYGHVRDLAAKNDAVLPDSDFAMTWDDSDVRGKKVMKEIADAVKGADKLILATDPDREGEAISWHILEVLSAKKALKKGMEIERVAFNAVTKPAILAALKEPRPIDQPLVSAYLARRALDYLVGFTLSPVLWRKLPGARSAGRVQSVALRLVCDREAEIEAFRTDEYWTIETTLATPKGETFPARVAAIDTGQFTVTRLEKKAAKRNPWPPFMTSTLQMDASRKLGFSAKQTMQVAQRLYEGVDIGGETTGLITYMRTDGVTIVPEAISAIRGVIAREFAPNYVAPFIREYKSKAKNAQEAHEAIRPTDPGRRPKDVARYLDRDQAALYELIWRRTMASQMASAELEPTSADIAVKGRDSKSYMLRATGSVVNFDGFLKAYEEGRDEKVRVVEKGKEDHAEDDADSRRLPPLAEGDRVSEKSIEAEQHFTQPPPRFSEATLVKRMEELGIGRPSTYASTMATVVERGYVKIDKKRLVPEDKGRLVTAFLESFFKKYVEFDYTAGLEEKLDLISDNKLDWKEMLREFWRDFIGSVEEIKDLRVGDVLDALNDMLGPHIFPDKGDGSDPRACPKCGTGRLSLKISSKNGAFIGCGNYPDCNFTRQLATGGENGASEERELGFDPESGLPVVVKNGRFGTYLQIGEGSKDEKPKRSSIPKGIDAATIDLEKALQLLSLPRPVGDHPEGGTIIAGLGRFGPFILHEDGATKTYANVASIEDVFTIGVNRAVTLIADKKSGKGGGRFGRAAQKTILKDLGEHPSEGGKIEVLDGKYGPYISHNKVNATVPKGTEPANLTVEDAVRLLEERIAKGGGKKPARKAAPNKAAAKKASSAGPTPKVPKPAAKKAPAKKTKAKAGAA